MIYRWRIFLFALPPFFAELMPALCLALLLGVPESFESGFFVTGVFGRSAGKLIEIRLD